MALAIFYDFGKYKGTARELADEFGVSLATMQGRLNRLQAGKIGLDKVLVSGKVIAGKRGGNAEWKALPDPTEGRPENSAKVKPMTRLDRIYGCKSEEGWSPGLPNV